MRKLLLFDIDGTLVLGGPAKDAFQSAMLDTFGTAGSIEDHDFSGKTDPQIARELLTGAGLGDQDIDHRLPILWDRYVGELERRLGDRPMYTLPAVLELIDALTSIPDVALGLVTGNLAKGARLKLTSVGLEDHFPVGGFGSDHEERNNLPGIALARARQQWSADFLPGDAVIVGDTPRDVECGQLEGMRTIAVATGRFDATTLEQTGADHTFVDFSDTDQVLNALLG